jgi:hypothetical protein
MDNPEIDEHGNKWWHDSDGNRHRDDGPAIEWSDGDKSWYQHGKCHRDDGPAVEGANGYKEWGLNGEYLSFEEWLDEVNISAEAKVMMKLQYG